MTRLLTPEMEAALLADTTRPILLFENEFASGTVRLWSGWGNLSWDGKTWTGGGTLIGIGKPARADTQARTAKPGGHGAVAPPQHLWRAAVTWRG